MIRQKKLRKLLLLNFFVGIADHSLGDFHGAIENHKQHLNISKVVGDREGEGRAYGNLVLEQ